MISDFYLVGHQYSPSVAGTCGKPGKYFTLSVDKLGVPQITCVSFSLSLFHFFQEPIVGKKFLVGFGYNIAAL
jgi:hypothetical protein